MLGSISMGVIYKFLHLLIAKKKPIPFLKCSNICNAEKSVTNM